MSPTYFLHKNKPYRFTEKKNKQKTNGTQNQSVMITGFRDARGKTLLPVLG